MLKKSCFSINTYFQLEELIKLKNNKKKILVILIKNYLIKGFGLDWLKSLIELVKKNHPNENLKFFVDAGNDPGLSIFILQENIDYLKLKADKKIIRKISQIAKKNKVLLNPIFNIVEVSKIKNIKSIKI